MDEEELEEYLARALHRADYGDTDYFPSARFTRMAKSLVPAVKKLLESCPEYPTAGTREETA